MEAIVGALLSASTEMLVEKIVSGEFVDLFQRTRLDVDLLEKLKITLLSLQSVLHDAEEKQITNPAVKEWLIMLQDAVFEAQDLFDEINTEALRREAEAGQVLKKFSSYFKRFNRKINSKLIKLFEKLEYLRKQKLGLKEVDSNRVWNTTPTSPFLGDESAIIGRVDDRKKLKEFLLSEGVNDGGSKIGVISIVGMGGLGKTTLANLLYNDPDVEGKFKVRGWSHIPKTFDVVTITKTILEFVTSGTITETNFVKLQEKLKQTLSNTKFLLVLDDIWHANENYVDWNKVSDIFNVGQIGSKIIITSRDRRAKLPKLNTLRVHDLRSLKTEDSWSLLTKHAFVETNYQQQPEYPNLEIIGKKIAEKCSGLPLAVVTLGGILRNKLSLDHWNDVLNSSIWEQTNNEVEPSLLLSYHFLPGYLKGCFAYCSIFPKNSILRKKTVVQLWIAEGLIPQSKSEKNWEKVAEEYFVELVSRSLIRQLSTDNETKLFTGDEECFEMHDLINDLAMIVSSPYCTRLDIYKPDERVEKRVRHLSFDIFLFERDNKFEKLCGLKGLRTFLPMPLQISWNYHNSVSSKLFYDLLLTMTQLHVLSLSNFSITELPNSIGNLIYLRYLNLSNTQIKRLPSETCKLYNLQTLLLTSCEELIELPKDVGKLVKLRHLDIRGTKLKEMPAEITKLENLQTLSDFVVSNVEDGGLKIEDLGKYPHLRGSLSISQLENVTDPSHASQANLEMKSEIDELELVWSYTPLNSEIQNVVLERLCPSMNLKSLAISGYGGDKLPNWLDTHLFSNMVCMRISGCKKISRLPSLGRLSNLKELFISGMESIKSVDIEFYGSDSPSFTSLETLSFREMAEWVEWKLIGGTSREFPRLKRLSLENCPKLRLNDCPSLMESRHSDGTSLPFDMFGRLMISLNSLQKMTLENIPTLTSFPSEGLPKTLQSLEIIDCENLEFLSHESFHNYTSLEFLHISNSCNSMTSFTLCSLPVLETLSIRKCKQLKSILMAEDVSKQNLLFLRSINISDCNELESVSISGLPIPNLTSLSVCWCDKLCCLPKSINTLTSLQSMDIFDLPNLQSFSINDLPISLQYLTIGNVGGIRWNTSWEHLTSLSKLDIRGDDIVKGLMKMQVPVLPTNLVTLWIVGLRDIECLDGKWLQHLTSLHKLSIWIAPKLKSLPEKGELPSSLQQLTLDDCPLLKAKLKMKKGKEWLNISHIPNITIY